MAASDSDFDEAGNISPENDEFCQSFEQSRFQREDTNILNLDDAVHESAVTESIVGDEKSYPQFEDQDTMSDDGQMSGDGVLDEDTICQGLSNVGRVADGTQQVFLHLTLPGYNLSDITLLQNYVHLQKVELPYNEIEDLSPLSNMPYLLELDVSHNQLTKLLDFTPPKNLKAVDLSYNKITEMTDLSAHHYLMKLNLDNNCITEIKGLENCKRLTHLSLAHNQISRIQGLDNLPLRNLNLGNNNLKHITNLESLLYLQTVHLAGNKIRSLKGLEDHGFLEHIDLEDNEVIDLSEIQFVKDLKLLRQLNLLRNPIQELPDYRLSILFHIQQLSELDRRKVEVDEKLQEHILHNFNTFVAATNMFNPPMDVIAARDHIMHVVYSFLQPSRVLDSTLPSIETPYPMLVLAGPQGAGKKDLALKLVEEFPDYFGYGIPHTTRKPHAEETNGKDYHFVTLEQFETDVKMGKFIETYSYQGNLFGLSTESVESVARDGLACVVHMELEGMMSLKNTYFEPRYVLIMPVTREAHERRLRERGVYSESQLEWTLDRGELYAEHNRQNPGFFDMMINSDDITEAYRKLRRLVMDYLGINVPSPSQSDVLEASQTGSQFLDREATETYTAGSANMGTRTWSKPSIPDSASQPVGSMRQKALSPMPGSPRGAVEEASLRRRQSAAKEAVAGSKPTIYEQILGKAPKTVPAPVSSQLGLGDEDPGLRSHSAPMANGDNMDALPPSSPDSSEGKDSLNSSLSNLSEARGPDADDASQVDSPKGSVNGIMLPSEAIDPLELMSGNSGVQSNSAPPGPRPDSRGSANKMVFGQGVRLGSAAGSQAESPDQGSRPGTAGSRPGTAGSRSARPGSEKHPVLPPIGGATKDPLPDY